MDGMDVKIVSEQVEPVVEEAGCKLVEVKVGRSRHLDDITVIIYKESGISLNDCTYISRAIRPRLDCLEDFDNITLKVSSPGIDRVIIRPEEYEIFHGKGVKVLLMDTKKWIGGIIAGVSDGKLRLRHQSKMIDIELKQIQKAKLDFTEEVESK